MRPFVLVVIAAWLCAHATPHVSATEVSVASPARSLPATAGCNCPNAIKARSAAARRLFRLVQDKDARARRGLVASN
jgi:hypothetical protein